MRKLSKKVSKFLIVSMVLAMLCAGSVMAGGDCGYGSDSEDDWCDIWWFDNAEEHWCACVTHKDENGKSPVTFGPEPHTFVDGRCTSCGRTEDSEYENTSTTEDDSAEITEEEKAAIEAEEKAAAEAEAKAAEEAKMAEEAEAAGEEESSGSVVPIIAVVALIGVAVGLMVFKKKK